MFIHVFGRSKRWSVYIFRVRVEIYIYKPPHTHIQFICWGSGGELVFWRGSIMYSVWEGICMFRAWEYLHVCVHRCVRIVYVY